MKALKWTAPLFREKTGLRLIRKNKSCIAVKDDDATYLLPYDPQEDQAFSKAIGKLYTFYKEMKSYG